MTDFAHRRLYKKLNYVVYAGTLCDLSIDCHRNDPNATLCCTESISRNYMSTVGSVMPQHPVSLKTKTAGTWANAERFKINVLLLIIPPPSPPPVPLFSFIQNTSYCRYSCMH
jgi:hypothetical protein